MVIISNMDTYIIYDIYNLNLIMSTNGKVSDLLIIMLITAPLAPTAGALFTPNTILLPQIPYFYISFRYLKAAALISLNKTENHEDLCLKIYALILAILICYLNLQHFKKLDQVSTESSLHCCTRSSQRSDEYTHAC